MPFYSPLDYIQIFSFNLFRVYIIISSIFHVIISTVTYHVSYSQLAGKALGHLIKNTMIGSLRKKNRLVGWRFTVNCHHLVQGGTAEHRWLITNFVFQVLRWQCRCRLEQSPKIRLWQQSIWRDLQLSQEDQLKPDNVQYAINVLTCIQLTNTKTTFVCFHKQAIERSNDRF